MCLYDKQTLYVYKCSATRLQLAARRIAELNPRQLTAILRIHPDISKFSLTRKPLFSLVPKTYPLHSYSTKNKNTKATSRRDKIYSERKNLYIHILYTSERGRVTRVSAMYPSLSRPLVLPYRTRKGACHARALSETRTA